MKKRFAYLFFLSFIIGTSACETNDNSKPHTQNQNDTNAKAIINDFAPNDTSLIIHFPELTLKITRYIAYDTSGLLKEMQGDTVWIFPDLYESVLGNRIEVHSASDVRIEMEQSYKSIVSAFIEGPTCDMSDWKQYYSDWKSLKKDSNQVFYCRNYSADERNKFLDVSLKELSEAIKIHCGEEWLGKKKKAKWGENCAVNISQVFIRIHIIKGKQKTTRMLVFDEAIGC